MQKFILTLTCLAVFGAAAQTTQPGFITEDRSLITPSPGIKNHLDSFSYSIGLNIAANLKEQGVEEINRPLLLAAFHDLYSGSNVAIDRTIANNIVRQHFETIHAKRNDAAKLASLSWMSENKKRPNIHSTLSGLQYEILSAGTGPRPTDSSVVRLHYKVSLTDGTAIDSSNRAKGVVQLRVNEIIPGWAEALKLMPAGSKWKIYIPFYLAYGEQAMKEQVPAAANLVYEVEVVGW